MVRSCSTSGLACLGQTLINDRSSFLANSTGPRADGSGVLVSACALRAVSGTGDADAGGHFCNGRRPGVDHADLGSAGCLALRPVRHRRSDDRAVVGGFSPAAERRLRLAACVRDTAGDGRMFSVLRPADGALDSRRAAAVRVLLSLVCLLWRPAVVLWTADLRCAGNRIV